MATNTAKFGLLQTLRGSHLSRVADRQQFLSTSEMPEIIQRTDAKQGQHHLQNADVINPSYKVKVAKMRRTVEMIDGKAVRRRRKKSLVAEETGAGRPHLLTPAPPLTEHRSLSSLKSRLSSSSLLSQNQTQGSTFFRKLKQLGKFVTMLIGLWKKHAKSVKDFLDDNVQIVDFDLPRDERLFNKGDFKADHARLSQTTKNIMGKTSHLRSPKEIRFVEIALRKYPEIAAYPEHIQTLIASRGWYERYTGRRIIIREGHPSRCFYFILSGSVIVSKLSDDGGVSRTQCYLGRGESFGEQAVLHNTRRTATCVSQGTLELLVITEEDFMEVFRSGELSDINDPILQHADVLKGWPVEALISRPTKAKVAFFKRGVVIADDTKESEWIYIIRSGSCDVIKKLKLPESGPNPDKEGGGLQAKDMLDTYSHRLALEKKMIELESQDNPFDFARKRRMVRTLELGVPVDLLPLRGLEMAVNAFAKGTDNLEDFSVSHMKPKPSILNSLLRFKEDIDNRRADNTQKLDEYSRSRRKSRSSRRNTILSFKEGSIITEVMRENLEDQETSLDQETFYNEGSFQDDSPPLSSTPGTPTAESAETKPVFIRIQTLATGDAYGLAGDIHDDQPNLSLISNGAECIMLNKKFFWDRAPLAMRSYLQKTISPYPCNKELQQGLNIHLQWNERRAEVVKDSLERVKLRVEAVNRK